MSLPFVELVQFQVKLANRSDMESHVIPLYKKEWERRGSTALFCVINRENPGFNVEEVVDAALTRKAYDALVRQVAAKKLAEEERESTREDLRSKSEELEEFGRSMESALENCKSFEDSYRETKEKLNGTLDEVRELKQQQNEQREKIKSLEYKAELSKNKEIEVNNKENKLYLLGAKLNYVEAGLNKREESLKKSEDVLKQKEEEVVKTKTAVKRQLDDAAANLKTPPKTKKKTEEEVDENSSVQQSLEEWPEISDTCPQGEHAYAAGLPPTEFSLGESYDMSAINSHGEDY